MSETKCAWRKRESILISVWNSFAPWSEPGLRRLMATGLWHVRTWPLYTSPKPPLPTIKPSSKLLVAALISVKEKLRQRVLEGSGLLLSSAAEPLLTYRKIKYPMMNDNNRNNDAATAEAIIRIFMLLLFGVLGDVGGCEGLELLPRLLLLLLKMMLM